MATHNHDGYPHMVPMWFSVLDGLVHMHTYKTSQKVVNVQRDPRGSLLVEDGVDYDKLDRLGSIQWPCNEQAPTGTTSRTIQTKTVQGERETSFPCHFIYAV